jgi:hypothetical protein
MRGSALAHIPLAISLLLVNFYYYLTFGMYRIPWTTSAADTSASSACMVMAAM